MNNFYPSCISLQEVMLENVKYNLGRECFFMQQCHQAKEAREGQQLQLDCLQCKDNRKKHNIWSDISTLLGKDCEMEKVMGFLKGIGMFEGI